MDWRLLVGLALAIGCDAGAPSEPDDPRAPPDAALDGAWIAPDANGADAAGTDRGHDAASPEPVDAAGGADAGRGDAAPPDAASPAVLAPQNAWGPAARVTALDVPRDPTAARRAGCLVHGAAAGTGLRNVLVLAGGGLGRFLRPDLQGHITLVLLLRAAGWPDGAGVADVSDFELQLLAGAHLEAERFQIAPRSFIDADPEAGPRVAVPALLDDGWVEHAPTPMFISLPLLTGPLVDVPLEHARLTGRLFPDGPGLGLADGILTGYLSEAGATALVEQVRVICSSEAPPAVCALFGDQINQPSEALVAQVIGLAGGYDVALDARGRPGPCATPEACNALAVCLEVSAEGVVVDGTAAP